MLQLQRSSGVVALAHRDDTDLGASTATRRRGGGDL